MSDFFYNQVDYTSRDYTSIRDDMVDQIATRLPQWTSRDVSDFGIVLIEEFANMGDILNYYIDRAANESFIGTATRRENVVSIARMLDYKPTETTPAVTSLRFSNLGVNSVAIPAGTQVASSVVTQDNVVQIVFETDVDVICPGTTGTITNKQQVTTTATLTTLLPHGFQAGTTTSFVAGVGGVFDGSHAVVATPTPTTFTFTVATGTVASAATTGTVTSTPSVTGSVTVSATQGVSITLEAIGNSLGTANQFYQLYRTPVLDDFPSAVCNGISYSYVEHLLDYGPYDPVFTTYTTTDQITYMVFGDGLHGRVPPFGAFIYANYRTGYGILGNVSTNSLSYILYPSSVTSSGVTVTNDSAAMGGTNRESIDSIRRNAPLSFYALNRAVTATDYGLLALRTPGVAKAKADSSVYSAINLYIAPTTGYSGIPLSTYLKESVQTYVGDRAQAGTTVTSLDPTIVDIYVTIDVKARPQFKRSVVRTSVINALLDLLSFDSVDLGDSISLMYVLASLDTVPGVLSCDITKFNITNAAVVTSQIDFLVTQLPRLLSTNIVATANVTYGLPDS